MAGPSLKTVKHLFAVCGNRCSYPGCTQEMVTDTDIVIGEICHITSSSPKGPRYNPALSDEERDSFPNLILFCPTHHKLVDDDIVLYTRDLLIELKERAARNGFIELTAADAVKAQRLHAAQVTINVAHRARVNVTNAQEIHAQTVKVNKARKVTKAIHPDSIATDLEMSGYVKYLISRYQKFQQADKDKNGRGKYVLIYNAIIGKFGRSWQDVAKVNFSTVAEFLQARICNTKLGRILKAQNNELFSSFSDWQKKPTKD